MITRAQLIEVSDFDASGLFWGLYMQPDCPLRQFHSYKSYRAKIRRKVKGARLFRRPANALYKAIISMFLQ